MTIPAYQQRVIAEHTELSDKLAKLNSFLASSHIGNLEDEDVLLLIKQSVAMDSLSAILQERICRFGWAEQELIDETQARR